MLILRRRCGQSITIGRNAEIIIKVLRNEDGIVSIGVDAPLAMLVDRLEICGKRLKDFPSTDIQKSSVFNRLKNFESRIKKVCASNDSLVDHELFIT